jgi:hypothetical protein
MCDRLLGHLLGGDQFIGLLIPNVVMEATGNVRELQITTIAK